LNDPREQNRRIWNERARRREAHAQPVSEKDFANARALVDECGWLPEKLAGLRVLCLAAGGGRHGPLFASLGADVTVVDISEEMLELDRKVCAARNLSLKTVQTSMDNLSMLGADCFEIVIQPVSTCYVPELAKAYKEIARVPTAGSLYISQHKQPASLQASALPGPAGYTLVHAYYQKGALPPEIGGLQHREAGAVEFIHTWEELLGAMCQAGFVIEDLLEPRHADPGAAPGSFAHRSSYLSPYVTVKARRRSGASNGASLWVPA